MSDHYEQGTDVEFITIVEGPAPDFAPIANEWPWSLHEGPACAVCAVCRLRTFDGEALAERCRVAWQEGRPVCLDYPDGEGGRQEAEIIAARADTIEEGDVLYLWVCL